MTLSPAARVHLMITFVMGTFAAVAGATFGLLLGGRTAAVVAAVVACLAAVAGSFLTRRQVLAFFRPEVVMVPARRDGHAEGLAQAVLMSIANYQAAAFPIIPGGVSKEEREARRTVAYRVSAYDGLPLAVRVSAAKALEAVDHDRDAARVQAAVQALGLAVYDHRAG